MSRARRVSIVALAGAFIIGGPLTGPAAAGFPGRNGEIAFEAFGLIVGEDEAGEETLRFTWGVYAVDPKSETTERVQDRASDPAWSPDGGRLAYTVTVEDEDGTPVRTEIHIDGVRLTRGYTPAWSPNGRHIAFVRDPKNRDAEIWRIKVDGTELTRLTRNRVDDTSPAWGTNNRIAFVRKGQIYTMGRNGGRVRQITRAKQPSWNPDWSPDGKWLAFNRGARWKGQTFSSPDAGRIFKLRLSDRKLVQLTKGGPWKSDPGWSPNGRRIVYVIGGGDDDSILAIMRANGTRRRVLNINVDGIDAEEAHWHPDWQPLPEPVG